MPPAEGGPICMAELTSAQASSSTMAADDAERCVICLMPLADRSRLKCGHEFCFTCIGVWANQSRRCPLCNEEMGEAIEHHLSDSHPTRFFLPPLPEQSFTRRRLAPQRKQPSTEDDARERAIERRRDIYARGVYAKHVPANEFTGYTRSLTPRDFGLPPSSSSSSMGTTPQKTRALAFLDRELRVWAPPDDVPRLAAHVASLLSAFDLRSEPAVRILDELVGDTYPRAAEHLAHELAAFLRSPFELEEWDEVVQYDEEPTEILEAERDRGRSFSRSLSPRSASLSPSRSPSRSRTRSVSPRDPARPDEYRPSPPRDAKRWDEADSWVDPEYAAELARRKRPARRERQRRDDQSARGRELLGRLAPEPGAFGRVAASAGLVIRGQAERRQSLLERLERAKAAGTENGTNASTPPGQPQQQADANRVSELREKLVAEKKRRQLREELMARKRAKSALGAVAQAALDVKAKARPSSRGADEGKGEQEIGNGETKAME